MKGLMLQDRDKQVLDFLEKYKCATTADITKAFYKNSKVSNRRLKLMRENGLIKSTREYVSQGYTHYINKKPTNLEHSLKLSSFIAELLDKEIEILKSFTEYKVGNVRSDCLLVLKYKDKVKLYFVEVINYKKFDIKKYQKLISDNASWEQVFPIFPSILVVGDKEVDKNKILDIVEINSNFTNIDNLLDSF